MNVRKKGTAMLAWGILFSFAAASPAYAMHIMEGYLPMGYCIAWGVVCIPFVVLGVKRINRLIKEHRKLLFDLCNGRLPMPLCCRPEISKCDRILQPPNGNRSGSHSLWPDSHGSDRLSGADFSGAFACTWRFDNAGSQYLQYGDCRSCCQLGRL